MLDTGEQREGPTHKQFKTSPHHRSCNHTNTALEVLEKKTYTSLGRSEGSGRASEEGKESELHLDRFFDNDIGGLCTRS